MAVKKKVVRKKQRSAPSGKGVLKKVHPVGDTHTNQVLLVYGRSGTGKTQFMSTLPRPILFLDVNERGLDTIRGEKQIDVLSCQEWQDFEDIFWALDEGLKYKSVVIDQITNLQDLGMSEIRDRAKKGPGELFTKKNWGELSGLLKTAISNFRGLSEQYNIGFIAHERTFSGGDDEEDGAMEPSVGARVMPSVGSFIDGAVDVIGSTYIKESFTGKGSKKERSVDYCMRIGPHAFYSTKVRRPVEAGPLPDFVVDPTFTKISNLIAGKMTPAKKTRKKIAKKRRS